MASVYPATSALPATANIQFRYLLDEASGNAVAETGGLNLTDRNTVTNTTGYTEDGATFDYARLFTAANSEGFYYNDNAKFDLTGSFTLAFFTKFTTVGVNHGLVAKWGASGDRAYSVRLQSNDKLQFAVTSDGAGTGEKNVVTDDSFVADTWYHITCVFEASTRLTVYVNGVENKENTTSIVSSVYNCAQDFEVGYILDDSQYLNGAMQDVIGLNTALSDAQVLQLYEKYTVASASGGAILAMMFT
jgi:hypothetical protein